MASKILVPGARVFIHCSKRGAPKNPLRGGRGAARTDGDARLSGAPLLPYRVFVVSDRPPIA